MPYFQRTGAASYAPTEHVGGAWATDEQHVAPALGLMTHLVEADLRARRDDDLRVTRLSFDILGVLPMEEVAVEVRVVRPGRTIELVEAVLTHGDRPAVLLRAWLQSVRDTAAVVGSDLPVVPGPEEVPAWDGTEVWPGGFIASVEIRRQQQRPGRALSWVRTDVDLLDSPASPTAAVAGLVDVTNGLTVREDPRRVAFPNLDLTVHLVRAPEPGWIGFDTTVTFGPDGHGLTSSVLHDEHGPIGTAAQTLTVRPLA